MAFNLAAVQAGIQGAASSGAFGDTAQAFSGIFGANPPAVSSRPLVVQTVPQTVNPAANPGAAVTDTSAPSASFLKGINGLGVSPTVVLAGLALLVLVVVVVTAKK